MVDYNIGQLVGQTTDKNYAGWAVGWSYGNGNTDNRSCVKLRFYLENGVTPSGIKMYFNDGTTTGFIVPPPPDDTKNTVDMPLSPGEMITSWTIFNRNDGGKGFAGFVIQTNMKNTYTIGTKLSGTSTPITTANLGSGLLTGFNIFWDANGLDILGLKPLFLKPFKSIVMSNLDFGATFTDMKMYTSPVTLADTTIENTTGTDQSWTFNDSISRQTSHQYAHSTAMMFGASVSVKVGFLDIVEATATAEWSFTDTYTTTDTITDTAQITWGASGTVKDNQIITATAAVWSGVLNLPYTATITVTMVDGTLPPLTYQDNGVYKNVQYSSAQVTVSAATKTKPTMTIKDHINARTAPIKASPVPVHAPPQLSVTQPKFIAVKPHATVNGFIPDLKTNKRAALTNGTEDRDDVELAQQLKTLGQAVNQLLQSKLITA